MNQVQRNIQATLRAMQMLGLSTDGVRFDAIGQILPFPGSTEWIGAGLPPVNDGDDTDAILVASGLYQPPFTHGTTMKRVTMFVSDHETIRLTSEILDLAIRNLDGITDSLSKSNLTRIEGVISKLEAVKLELHELDVHAIVYQIPPGRSIPE